MSSNHRPYFLVIDDDPINNLICNKIIQITIPDAQVATFSQPENGIEHIMQVHGPKDAPEAIVLLDINMPSLNGWEALDKIREFPAEIKARLKIFMLSSSVDPCDKIRAGDDDLVAGYIVKPLSQLKVQTIHDGLIE